jgi:hypothetical protein
LLIHTSSFFSSHCSCAVELSSNYLTYNNSRRTLIPPFLPTLLIMTSRCYPSFALLTRALHPVMSVSTNACLKLGLLHNLFPFSCHAINPRKTHAACCTLLHKRRVYLSRMRCTFRFPRIFCDRLTLSRTLACCSYYYYTLYRPTHLYMYVRNITLSLPTLAPPQDQLFMVFTVTDFEIIVRYNTTTGYLANT